MKVGKPCEGVTDLILWIWLSPIMLLVYIFMVGNAVKDVKGDE